MAGMPSLLAVRLDDTSSQGLFGVSLNEVDLRLGGLHAQQHQQLLTPEWKLYLGAHIQVSQGSDELRLSAGQVGAALKVASSLLDLVLLQTELSKGGDADVALRVDLESVTADLLGLGESVLVGLEDAEGLVDQRKDVLQVAVPVTTISSSPNVSAEREAHFFLSCSAAWSKFLMASAYLVGSLAAWSSSSSP